MKSNVQKLYALVKEKKALELAQKELVKKIQSLQRNVGEGTYTIGKETMIVRLVQSIKVSWKSLALDLVSPKLIERFKGDYENESEHYTCTIKPAGTVGTPS